MHFRLISAKIQP